MDKKLLIDCSRGLFRLRHGTTWLLIFLFFSQSPPFAAAQDESSLQSSEDFGEVQVESPFNKSTAIIMLVVMGTFFCFGFLCVYLRRCTERHIAGNFGYATAGGGGSFFRAASPKGLDPEFIKTFPTFQFGAVKGHKIGKGTLECAVCLNEFEDHETLRLIPKCNHAFHTECIDAWLSFHNTCPVCRAQLVPKPGEPCCIPVLAFDPSGVSDGADMRHPVSGQVLTRDSGGVIGNDLAGPARSPQVNINRSPMLRFGGLFKRSNSTGHSPFRPGEDCERFTLRLPEDVQNQLLNTPLKRTKSFEAIFPRTASPKMAFVNNERFNPHRHAGRRGFLTTPPFVNKTGSSRSPFKFVKSPGNRVVGLDNVGERSFIHLRSDAQV